MSIIFDHEHISTFLQTLQSTRWLMECELFPTLCWDGGGVVGTHQLLCQTIFSPSLSSNRPFSDTLASKTAPSKGSSCCCVWLRLCFRGTCCILPSWIKAAQSSLMFCCHVKSSCMFCIFTSPNSASRALPSPIRSGKL